MELKEGFFNAGEIQIHYIEGPASGTPLVFLHGATGDGQAWNHLLPELTQRWHVYALDLRGHGQSGWGKGAETYHVSRNASDIVAFLREQVKEKAVLVGHSWGGVIALVCAAQTENDVRGLILEDPPFGIRREGPELKPYMEYFSWISQIKKTAHTLDAMKAAILETYPDGMPAEYLEPYAKRLLVVDPVFLAAIQAGSQVMGGVDLAFAVRTVKCPILLFQADSAMGSALTQEDVDVVLANAPDTRLIKVPGVGHMIHDERPTEFIKAIDTFLIEPKIIR